MFEIHRQLQEDCIIIGSFGLSQLLMMNDSNYPWFILVPARENKKELFDLDDEDQVQLIKEITLFSKFIANVFKADKMNIAALGNAVSQLHVHIIARFKDDPAWPAPVWGKTPAKPYSDEGKKEIIIKLREFLNFDFTSASDRTINNAN
ncbi:HIT domain-containing protein [bacterium]|nr:MAG: HIT domain-containing protein [bacterium]